MFARTGSFVMRNRSKMQTARPRSLGRQDCSLNETTCANEFDRDAESVVQKRIARAMSFVRGIDCANASSGRREKLREDCHSPLLRACRMSSFVFGRDFGAIFQPGLAMFAAGFERSITTVDPVAVEVLHTGAFEGIGEEIARPWVHFRL